MAEIIGTGYQRAAKNSRVSIGGTNLAQAKWNCDGRGDDIDTVNFESEGYGEGILGVIELAWSFGGLWDAGTDYFVDPPGVYPRDDLANLKLWTNVTDGDYVYMPYARVRSSTVSAEVRQGVSFDSAGSSQGVWTDP